jgi:hypothetical protein
MKSAIRCVAVLGLGLAVLAAPLAAQQSVNPFEAFKSALKKALPPSITAPPTQSTGQPNPRAAERPAGTAASAGSAGTTASAEPFSMDETKNDAQPAPVVKLGDYKNMPSIVGVHLTMPLQEALGALRAEYKGAVQLSVPQSYDGYDQRTLLEFGVGINVLGSPPETIYVEATSPPQEQRIWRVNRRAGDYNHPTLHGPLVASLRQKYGKETVAFSGLESARSVIDGHSEAQIRVLWWLFDEQGRPARLPPGGVDEINANTCLGQFAGIERSQSIFPHNLNDPDAITKQTYCNTSLVMVRADIGDNERVGAFYVDMVDVPIVSRAARATFAMLREAAIKHRQAELKKAEQNKPAL